MMLSFRIVSFKSPFCPFTFLKNELYLCTMNTLKTTFLMALMTVLFLVVGKSLGGDQGMKMAFGLAIVMNFFSYWFSDKLVLKMYGAKEVNESEAPQLYAMVRRLAQKGELPMPKVYIVQNPTPNAFATGRSPNHAAVAVTTGILNLLNNDELSGVVGHELSHIRNRDTLIGTIAATFAGAIAMLANLAHYAALFGGHRSDENRRGGHPLIFMLSLIFAPIAATLIQMAISRSREYMADRGGAKLCGNPMALARALDKLQRGAVNMPMDAKPSTAHMFIVNPLSGLRGLTSLFRTHPLTEERIKRLEEMARTGMAA